MRLIKEVPHIDFMGRRKIGYTISLFLIVVGVLSLFLKGGEILGIDFTGGSLLNFYFTEPVSLKEIRETLNSANIRANIQSYEGNRGFILRTREENLEKLRDTIKTKFSGHQPELREERSIGPVVGKLLRRQAFLAVCFALIGMLIYLAWRFEFIFGASAVICLFHDVIITLGICALTSRLISVPLIAAFLTVVGYSVNDTIVLFDRVRENMKLMRGKEFSLIINESINQVLSRTILTSLTTLLALLSLFFLGTPTIKDFSFAIIVGILVGTYSSIFIASPIVLAWRKEKKRRPYRRR
ncbi:protein translocase subunit SecF [Candidatus Calescamantes bacterium]|nr:protein translocase subunit SecF [Candidatus Calescamantes bacterium]